MRTSISSYSTRDAVGAGLAGIIALGSVGLANAASNDTDGTLGTLTAVDDAADDVVDDAVDDAVVADSSSAGPPVGCDDDAGGS